MATQLQRQVSFDCPALQARKKECIAATGKKNEADYKLARALYQILALMDGDTSLFSKFLCDKTLGMGYSGQRMKSAFRLVESYQAQSSERAWQVVGASTIDRIEHQVTNEEEKAKVYRAIFGVASNQSATGRGISAKKLDDILKTHAPSYKPKPSKARMNEKALLRLLNLGKITRRDLTVEERSNLGI